MYIFTIIFIVVLLGISALLSATETAITAASPGKIQKLRSEGNKKALLVLSILKVKDKVISTLLIGLTINNTVCTTIATSLFIEVLGDDLGTLVASCVMAFVIIVFAEVIPKAIAVAKAEQLALYTANMINLFLRILRPVNAMLDVAVKVFCFIFRIDLTHKISGIDEVRGIIEHQHQEGHVYKDDRDMLSGVIELRGLTVSEVMVHRSNLEALNVDLPIETIIKKVLISPYSRIPFWKDSKDNIIGVLLARDLLKAVHQNSNDLSKVKIKDILSPPWFIPDNTLVLNQLNAFKDEKKHIAFVVDEYGDLQGVITLEDAIEEIVGQIQDERDMHSEFIVKKGEGKYLIDGSTTLREINRELDWDLPDNDANTIAGLIMFEAQRIPAQGEEFYIFDLKVKIMKKESNKIVSVFVTKIKNKE